MIDGFSKPIRLDRSDKGGGIMLFTREDIPCKQLNPDLMGNIEGIFIEINLRKQKWLLFAGYNPQKANAPIFFQNVGKSMDKLISQYDNIILIGDFNVEPHETSLSEFCEIHNLKNLVMEPTCFKSLTNPTCIDLILTNRSMSFQHTTVIETGISDHHKMVLTVMKSTFPKISPKIIYYRNYSKFNNGDFRNDLKTELLKVKNSDMDYDTFEDIFSSTLTLHAPLKQKLIRANNSPFMTKLLRQNISHRTKLRNKFLKNPSGTNNLAYKRQRNKCVKLLRNEKRRYYNNLNLKCLKDSRTFWRAVKPFFSEKSIKCAKIVLVEDNNR